MYCVHDDVMARGNFPHHFPLVRESHLLPVIPLTEGPVMRSSDIFNVVSLNKLFEQSFNMAVIWDAMALAWRYYDDTIVAVT